MQPPTACQGWAQEMDLCNDPAIVRVLGGHAHRTGSKVRSGTVRRVMYTILAYRETVKKYL